MDEADIDNPRKRSWSDLSTGQQMALAGAAAVQIGLAVVAWTDLARRPAEQVHGPKLAWAAVIAVNFVGPISYFVWGREPGVPEGSLPATEPSPDTGPNTG